MQIKKIWAFSIIFKSGIFENVFPLEFENEVDTDWILFVHATHIRGPTQENPLQGLQHQPPDGVTGESKYQLK